MRRPKTMEAPTAMNIRVPQSMYEALLAIAETKGVSVATVARWAFDEFINVDKVGKEG